MLNENTGILNQSPYTVHDNYVTIDLNIGQTFEAEPKAFIAGRHVNCITRNSSTGFMNALARAFFSEESIFTNTFTGLAANSWIRLAPPHLGQIASYKLKDTSDKIYLVKGSYLGSTSNINLSTKFHGLFDLKGVGNVTIEASINPYSETEGEVLFHSNSGSIIPVEVTPEDPVMVDNNHIIAFTGKAGELDCTYKMLSPSVTGFFASGEGYVCEFSGRGTVFVRSHTPPPPPQKNNQN